MEPAVGEVWSSGRDGSNLLGLPGPCSWDDDDEPLGLGGIKPKSSPIPRRRSSDFSCSDDESQPPPSSSRRVSFADAFGLSLVSVKQFDSRAMCGPSAPLESDLRGNEVKEYFLSQLFTLPPTAEELIQKVQENKLELESLELLPGTTTLKGTIRVLNLCFDKLVYIRTSLDRWSSHFDLLAEYIPGSSDGDTDCFSFRLTLVPPFGEQGARVDFCLRYETPFGSFWANNSGQNYVLFCHEKARGQSQNEKKHTKKSCLKSTSRDCSSETSSTSSTEDIPGMILNCGMAALTEPVKEEPVKENLIKLQEENIRNRSRRSRRKAARLAKVKQYFADREEKDNQQIAKDTSEAAVKANVENPVPEKVEEPSNLSTTQTDVWMEMQDRVSLSPAKEIKKQKCTSGSVVADTDSKQVSATHIQTQDKEKFPVRHCELTTSISQAVLSPVDPVNCYKSAVSSVSQALDNVQNKETLTGQAVSITQQLLERQSSETSISKSVEKAWECFEKGAVGRMGSTMDIRVGEDTTSSKDKANHVDILENKPDVQPSGHNFTFETIVAPLYHQVFERMETERRDFMNTKFNARRSAGKLEDECLRTVTYQSYPRTQSIETRPKSEKHKVNDVYHGASRELCPPDLFNTKDATEEPLSDTNVNRELAEMEATFHDISVTDISENPLDTNISQSKTTTHKQHLANSLPFQLECFNRASMASLAECIPDQEEQQHQDRMILQSECLLETTLEDTLHNTRFQSECPPENSQQEQTTVPVVHMDLTTQSDLYSTSAKTSPSIASENPSPTDSSVTHISFETGLITEVAKIQSKEAKTLQPRRSEGTQMPMESTFTEILPSSKCLEESHSLNPESSSFCTHISSNVTPNFNQSESPELSHNLTSLTPLTSFEDSQKAAGIILAQFQIVEGTNLIQGSEKMSLIIDGNSHHTGSETKSNSDRNEETDGSERTNINPEEKTLDGTSLHPLSVNQIHENEKGKESSGLSSTNYPNVVPLETEVAKVEVELAEEKEEEEKEEEKEEKAEKEEEEEEEKEEEEEEEEEKEEKEENEHKQLEKEEKSLQEQKQERQEPQNREDHEHKQDLQEEEQSLEEQKQEEDQKPEHEHKQQEELEVEEHNLEQHKQVGKEEQEQELEDEQQNLEDQNQKEREHKQQDEQEEEEHNLEQHKQEGKEDHKREEHEHKQQEEREDEEEQNLEQKIEGKDAQKQGEANQKREEQEHKQQEEPEEENEELEEEEVELEEEQEDDEEEELGNENTFEDELLYLHDDDEEEAEKETKQKDTEQCLEEDEDEGDHLSLEVEAEEQDRVSRVSSVATLENTSNVDSFKSEVHLQVRQDLQSTSRTSEEGCSISGEEEKPWETDSSQRALTGIGDTTFSDRVRLICREEDVCCQTKEQQAAGDAAAEVNKLQENTEDIREQSEKNVADDASTESLTDDEMDLYLHKLKSTQQPGLKDSASNGNYSKRSSLSRTRTMPSRMPSISESVDEDQPNASLEDLTNEEMAELEKATLPLVDEEEEILRRNVLWWREFFSSDNMSKMIGYTFVLLVFLVTAYYYDFVACFGLYLLALYWLYFRGESEPFKVTQPNR